MSLEPGSSMGSHRDTHGGTVCAARNAPELWKTRNDRVLDRRWNGEGAIDVAPGIRNDLNGTRDRMYTAIGPVGLQRSSVRASRAVDQECRLRDAAVADGAKLCVELQASLECRTQRPATGERTSNV